MRAVDKAKIGKTTLLLVQGDITDQHVDAIVNAANSTLLGGGGVDGAIHRRGGPDILAACKEIRRTRFADGLPTGQAVATTAGRLRAKMVIHTVGPRWRVGSWGEPKLLEIAYRSSLTVAEVEGARSVAFPSISTGAYGYPLESAASVAVKSVAARLREHPEAFDEVRLVLFSEADFETYAEALDGLDR